MDRQKDSGDVEEGEEMKCKQCSLLRRAEREARKYPFKLPSIASALEFRRENFEWTAIKMAQKLGMQKSHYSEVIHGKRRLSINATKKAYALGVPASVLLRKNP